MINCNTFAETQRDNEAYIKEKLDQNLFKKMQSIESKREKEQRADKQSEQTAAPDKMKMQRAKSIKRRVSSVMFP